MTTQEIMEQVYKEAGEPSDLCPYTVPGDDTTFDITTPGAVRLLRYVNQALVRIANWQFPDGRAMRFKNLIERIYFQSNAPLPDVVSDAAAGTITVLGFTTNVVDQFRGWIVEVTSGIATGQRALVIGNTVGGGGECILRLATTLGTLPVAADTVNLYKGFWKFVGASIQDVDAYHIPVDSGTEMLDVMRVRDVELLQDLTPTERTDIFTAGILQPGVPSLYRVMGGSIYVDVPVSEPRTFEMVYLRQPRSLAAVADRPELPLQFHEAIVMWATHNIQRLNSDYDGAYATKRELETLLSTVRLQGYNDMELEDGGFTVYS